MLVYERIMKIMLIAAEMEMPKLNKVGRRIEIDSAIVDRKK